MSILDIPLSEARAAFPMGDLLENTHYKKEIVRVWHLIGGRSGIREAVPC